LLSIHPPSRIESYNSSASRPRIAIASRGVICPRPCRWDAGTLDERAGDWAHHLQRDGGRNRRRRCVHERPLPRRLAEARPQADLDRRPHHTRQDIETRNRYLRVLFVQAAWVVLITPKSWQPPRLQAVARSGQEAAASQRPRHRARQQARSLPLAITRAKCVQGLVHPWRREAFRRSIQWIGRNCARLQPIVATVSQHPGRKRCELAGGNLKQKARSQWLPARALIARSSAAISRRRSIACAV
jgi:hypothetical protein